MAREGLEDTLIFPRHIANNVSMHESFQLKQFFQLYLFIKMIGKKECKANNTRFENDQILRFI